MAAHGWPWPPGGVVLDSTALVDTLRRIARPKMRSPEFSCAAARGGGQAARGLLARGLSARRGSRPLRVNPLPCRAPQLVAREDICDSMFLVPEE